MVAGIQTAARAPLGCMILVFARECPIADEQAHNNYRNHYLARRQISSEGWVGSEVPKGLLAKIFQAGAIVGGMNQTAEFWFFVGRFYRGWGELKGKNKLDPAKHRLKFVGVDGYRFPDRFLHSQNFKETVSGFQFEVVEHNGKEYGFAK